MTALCGSFCHDIDNRSLVDRLLKSTPDGKLTVFFKSGIFGGQNVWLSELKVLTLQVSVFLAV